MPAVRQRTCSTPFATPRAPSHAFCHRNGTPRTCDMGNVGIIATTGSSRKRKCPASTTQGILTRGIARRREANCASQHTTSSVHNQHSAAPALARTASVQASVDSATGPSHACAATCGARSSACRHRTGNRRFRSPCHRSPSRPRQDRRQGRRQNQRQDPQCLRPRHPRYRRGWPAHSA